MLPGDSKKPLLLLLTVLLDLTLATLCYGALLMLLGEWRPTRRRLAALLKMPECF
jgi:hypothetical protein